MVQSRLKKWLANAFASVRSSQFVRDDSGVALVAIAVVAGGAALATTAAVIQREAGVQAELRDTRGQRLNFDRIQGAIEVYAMQDFDSPGGTAGSGGETYRLPCPANPADGDGQSENWDGSNTCAGNNRGIVPWATLGLAERDVVDKQGNYITYIVHASDSMEVCNGSSARSGTLDDLNSTANAKFALISHGDNGFGAYGKEAATRKDAPSSAEEIANCPVPNGGNCNGTTVPNANAFRSGPASSDTGSFFDDIVKSVQMDTSVTAECEQFFGEDPVSAGTTGTREVVERTFQRTQNSSGNQLNQPSVSEIDPDGQADTGDELIALRFQNNDNFASAACAHQESTYPLEGHTIRVYSQVAFKSEVSAGSDQGSGNGIVFGFAGHKQTDDDVATSVSNTDCGGTDK